jgi:outer membrane protein TolC
MADAAEARERAATLLGLEGGTDILAPEAAAPMPKPSRPEQIELLPDRKKDAPW